MCFRRQGAERHASGVEAHQDVFEWLNLIERDRSDVITQTEQVADGGYGTVVYQLSKLAVLLVITTAYGILNGAHYVRVDHVVFATVDELQQTTLLDAF